MSGCLMRRQKGSITSRDGMLWCAYAVSEIQIKRGYFPYGSTGGKYSLRFVKTADERTALYKAVL